MFAEEAALTEAATRRTNRLVLWTVTLSIVATTCVAAIPFLRFAYDNVTLHVALETAEALIGALLAFLAIGRFRTSRRATDLLLGSSLALLAATNLLLATAPNIIQQERAVGLATWATAGLRPLGAVGIMAAALLGSGTARGPTPRRIFALTLGSTAAVLALALAAELLLGEPIDATIEATASNRPTLVGHPVILGLQLAGAAAYTIAAYGFIRGARRGDELMLWFAVGSVLAGFSRIHYFLFASLYTSWVSTGDVFRLASYLAFLVGAGHEIGAYWRAQAEVGANRERSRLARELHDGLTQDLSFIRSQTVGRTTFGQDTAEAIADASGRALLESRRLVRLFSEPAPTGIEETLRAAAGVVAERGGAEFVVTCTGQADRLQPTVVAAIARITREATGNAVRHGSAQRVTVTLDISGAGGSLRVEDDGAGFDPTRPSDGFGLAGMRARAEELGGGLSVRSAPGDGTVVDLRW